MQLSLTNNGDYRWDEGEPFTITSAHVGVPLELRVGKREQLADLDAIVLHLGATLTPAELDALYNPSLLAADFTLDGRIDGADLAAWATGFGTTTGEPTSGDANGDGIVDGADFLQWQRAASSIPSPATLATVPEPSAGFLALLGLAILSCGRGRSPGREFLTTTHFRLREKM